MKSDRRWHSCTTLFTESWREWTTWIGIALVALSLWLITTFNSTEITEITLRVRALLNLDLAVAALAVGVLGIWRRKGRPAKEDDDAQQTP